MKRKVGFLLILFIMMIGILVACGEASDGDGDTEDTGANQSDEVSYQPEDIDPETDVCEICAMAIADDQYATQIILENERVLKFDDLGCLYEWLEKNDEEDVGAIFVRDFNTKEWVLLEDASFVFDEEINTPMAYGVISFKEKADAEKYIEENNQGDLKDAADLDDHQWKMMEHDHDHDHGEDEAHDHDGEGHDDHDHGFHTEGFDMDFKEHDHVVVGDDVSLEVELTLDEKALADANVRYEIWLEDDKEEVDWVDTEEVAAGSYVADHSFEQAGIYTVQVHVEDDEDLHEHMAYEIDVKE